jgi:hypothetical protein
MSEPPTAAQFRFGVGWEVWGDATLPDDEGYSCETRRDDVPVELWRVWDRVCEVGR